MKYRGRKIAVASKENAKRYAPPDGEPRTKSNAFTSFEISAISDIAKYIHQHRGEAESDWLSIAMSTTNHLYIYPNLDFDNCWFCILVI